MWPLINKTPKNIKNDLYETSYLKHDVKVGFTYNSILTGDVDGKREILDKIFIEKQIESWLSFIDTLHWSKYLKKPKTIKIIIGDECKEEKSSDMGTLSLGDIYSPRWSLEKLYLPYDLKEKILISLRMQKYKKKLFNDWKLNADFSSRPLILNFYGPAGTGKSITAEAIANELGKKVCKVNYSQLESKYVGETPKNIHNIFSEAKKRTQ